MIRTRGRLPAVNWRRRVGCVDIDTDPILLRWGLLKHMMVLGWRRLLRDNLVRRRHDNMVVLGLDLVGVGRHRRVLFGRVAGNRSVDG